MLNPKQYRFLNFCIASSIASFTLLPELFFVPAQWAFAASAFLGTFLFYSLLRNCISKAVAIALAAGSILFFLLFLKQQPTIPFELAIQMAALAFFLWLYTRHATYVRSLTLAKGLVIGCAWASAIGLLMVFCALSPTSFASLWASIALWICSLSLLNDVLDMPTDKNQIRTFPLVYGIQATYLFSFLLIIATKYLIKTPVSPLLFFLVAALAVKYASPHRAHFFIEIGTVLWMLTCWLL